MLMSMIIKTRVAQSYIFVQAWMIYSLSLTLAHIHLNLFFYTSSQLPELQKKSN